jgi:hypothetical protein
MLDRYIQSGAGADMLEIQPFPVSSGSLHPQSDLDAEQGGNVCSENETCRDRVDQITPLRRLE